MNYSTHWTLRNAIISKSMNNPWHFWSLHVTVMTLIIWFTLGTIDHSQMSQFLSPWITLGTIDHSLLSQFLSPWITLSPIDHSLMSQFQSPWFTLGPIYHSLMSQCFRSPLTTLGTIDHSLMSQVPELPEYRISGRNETHGGVRPSITHRSTERGAGRESSRYNNILANTRNNTNPAPSVLKLYLGWVMQK